MRRLTLCFVTLVLAAVLAGCGQGSAGAFKSKYAAIERGSAGWQTEIIQATQSFKTSTPQQLEATFADSAKRVNAFKESLAALTPPSNAKAGYSKYLDGLGRTAADLQTVSGDIANTHSSENTMVAHLKTLAGDVTTTGSSRRAFEQAAGIS